MKKYLWLYCFFILTSCSALKEDKGIVNKTIVFTYGACSDSIYLYKNGSATFYSCDTGDYFDSQYLVKKNILELKVFDFISQVDPSSEKEMIFELEIDIRQPKLTNIESFNYPLSPVTGYHSKISILKNLDR